MYKPKRVVITRHIGLESKKVTGCAFGAGIGPNENMELAAMQFMLYGNGLPEHHRDYQPPQPFASVNWYIKGESLRIYPQFIERTRTGRTIKDAGQKCDRYGNAYFFEVTVECP